MTPAKIFAATVIASAVCLLESQTVALGSYWYSDVSSADNAIDINDGNGAIPACGNDLMMNRIYREQFLFSGFIVSDCDSIGEPSFEEYIGRRVSRSGPACDLQYV